MRERMAESNKQDLLIDRISDRVSNSKSVKTGLAVLGVGALAGCAVTPPAVETVPTPAEGQALPIGLLNAEKISSLPEGEVKNSLQSELSSVKAECVSIPGCMGDTIQIYRVIVPDDVYSIRFADFKTENEAEHTEILSMMDGKTQETTTIQKDLLAKEAVIDGVKTRAFGYVDDLGNSHYVFVDQGENKYLFDAEQNPYKVITQNEKEAQAYSSFWSDPIVAEAAPLPTPMGVVAPTLKPTATVEVIVEEKPNIYMDERIGYGGRQFDFEISMLPSDKSVSDAFKGYGIESISINEDKADARELLAKTIMYSFLETYNFQNGTDVGLEEFVSNPEKYPEKIMMRNKDGKLIKQVITIDQINSFEVRYTYAWDRALYMGMSPMSVLSFGYGFENGKFTFYRPILPKDEEINFTLSINLNKVTELPYDMGYLFVQRELITALGFMPYTVYRIEESGDVKKVEDKGIFDGINKINNSLWPGGKMSKEEGEAWMRAHSSFKVSIR